MATFRTSKGRAVPHCHVEPDAEPPCDDTDLTHDEIADRRAEVAADFPDVIEVGRPTLTFNCHGFAFANAHGWFESPTLFVQDDFSQVPFDEARAGDVVIYKKKLHGRILHSAIVEAVADGKIQTCRSKWGDAATLVHRLREVPRHYYGRPWRLLRREV